MMSFGRIAGLLCLVACAHRANVPPDEPQSSAIADYRVTIFDNLGGARVHACFKGMPPADLVPMDGSAASRLRGAWVDGLPLETKEGRILSSRVSAPACVEYETQFERSPTRLEDSSARIVSQTQWLWRPDPFPRELSASIRFRLPDEGQVSLSWSRSNGAYLPERSAFFVETFGVFGVFDQQAFSLANTEVDVARLGAWPVDIDVRRWLSLAVQTSASVGGRFPRDRIQFVIVPVDAPGEQVAFGMLRRGGGSSILLLPSLDSKAAELASDWVAVHELSHLWLPRVRVEDRWLSEGIATYLQEVLRARCGLQSGGRAWKRIREGFERGRDSGTGRSLADESRSMNRTQAYQRVYWAGVAFALETDVRLRRATAGKNTLLLAISEAQSDWDKETHPVSASRVLAALDEASGTDFIRELGVRYAASSNFPDTSYVDSPRYHELRAQITLRADDGCKINGESLR